MRKILTFSLLVLIAIFSNISNVEAQESDQIKSVLTNYLTAMSESDFDKLTKQINPVHFEKVATRNQMKPGFTGFLDNPQFSSKFGDFKIESIAPTVKFEGSLYSTARTSQFLKISMKSPLKGKEKKDITDAFRGMFGVENTKLVGNDFEINFVKFFILSKAKGSRWYVVEYVKSEQKAADAVIPKGAQTLLKL